LSLRLAPPSHVRLGHVGVIIILFFLTAEIEMSYAIIRLFAIQSWNTFGTIDNSHKNVITASAIDVQIIITTMVDYPNNTIL